MMTVSRRHINSYVIRHVIRFEKVAAIELTRNNAETISTVFWVQNWSLSSFGTGSTSRTATSRSHAFPMLQAVTN